MRRSGPETSGWPPQLKREYDWRLLTLAPEGKEMRGGGWGRWRGGREGRGEGREGEGGEEGGGERERKKERELYATICNITPVLSNTAP